MRFSWFLLVLALCGVASAQRLDDVANSALETSKVNQVRFEGLQNVDDASLMQYLKVHDGDVDAPAVLASKVRASVLALHGSGLFDDVSAYYDYLEDDKGLDVLFRLRELPALDTFRIEGNEEVSSEDLNPKLNLLQGDVYSKATLERARQVILSEYKAKGYLMAEVSIQEIPREESQNEVVFTVTEGEKVVVQSIQIEGNGDVGRDDIVAGMGIELASWMGTGEFQEEVFESARDSVLATCKSYGYLDARLTRYEAAYLPDSTFRFYAGRLYQGTNFAVLQQQMNREISGAGSVLQKLAGKAQQGNSHGYRKFRKSFAAPAVPVLVVDNESEALELLNGILGRAELRSQWIESLAGRKWQDARIDSLLAQGSLSDFDERKLVRISLEEVFPALNKWLDGGVSSQVEIRIAIELGRRYYAGNVFFSGNEVLSEPMLRTAVRLDSSKVFNYKAYEATKKGVLDMYREEGYLFVRLDEKMEYRDSILVPTLVLTEGLPAMVRRVEIRGNTRTKDKVIRREIQLFPGDTYRQSRLERSFRDIFQLNYFDNLVPDIQPVEGSEQDIDVVFHVTEREAGTGTFSAGMAYSAADGLVGTLGLSIPNCCMGDGQVANVNLEWGADKKNLTLGFAEPWMWDKPIKFGGSVNYTWTAGDSEDEDITQWGGRVYLGSRLTFPDDYFYGQVDYGFQYYDQGDNVEGSLIRQTGKSSSVGVSLIRDDKNLPIFPTEGSRMVASVTKYGVVWDDFSYLKSSLSLKWWFPVLEIGSQTLSLGVTNEYGVISGNSLQYSSLFQMGGALGYEGLMRGYSPGTIGYRRLGRSYQFMSMEFTYPIAENRFYLLPLFFDAGNVFGKRYNPAAYVSQDQPSALSEWDLSSLKRDVGFGFRIIVPMLGIIGFDFAWPLDPGETLSGYDGTDIGDMQFNFLIGQGF